MSLQNCLWCAQGKSYTNIWARGPKVMHMMIDKPIMSCLLRWLECWNWLTYFLEIIVFCTGGVLLDYFIIVFVNHKLRVSFCMLHINICMLHLWIKCLRRIYCWIELGIHQCLFLHITHIGSPRFKNNLFITSSEPEITNYF